VLAKQLEMDISLLNQLDTTATTEQAKKSELSQTITERPPINEFVQDESISSSVVIVDAVEQPGGSRVTQQVQDYSFSSSVQIIGEKGAQTEADSSGLEALLQVGSHRLANTNRFFPGRVGRDPTGRRRSRGAIEDEEEGRQEGHLTSQSQGGSSYPTQTHPKSIHPLFQVTPVPKRRSSRIAEAAIRRGSSSSSRFNSSAPVHGSTDTPQLTSILSSSSRSASSKKKKVSFATPEAISMVSRCVTVGSAYRLPSGSPG